MTDTLCHNLKVTCQNGATCTQTQAYFNPTLHTLSLSVCIMLAESVILYSLYAEPLCLSQSHIGVVDLPCPSRSWPPNGSRGGAHMPVWTRVGSGWHSAAGGPWWSGFQSSACTGAASVAPQGHRTHCTLTTNWPPSWETGEREGHFFQTTLADFRAGHVNMLLSR